MCRTNIFVHVLKVLFNIIKNIIIADMIVAKTIRIGIGSNDCIRGEVVVGVLDFSEITILWYWFEDNCISDFDVIVPYNTSIL